jgi:O-antigen/teichoic acid export membrane protein
MKLWIGDAVIPPMMLLLSFGIWKIIESVGGAIAMFLNGANVVRTQVIFSSLTAIFAISLKFLLINKYGVIGAITATIFSYLIFSLIPYFYYIKKLMGNHTTRPIQ